MEFRLLELLLGLELCLELNLFKGMNINENIGDKLSIYMYMIILYFLFVLSIVFLFYYNCICNNIYMDIK
jgi:hypothetical protein